MTFGISSTYGGDHAIEKATQADKTEFDNLLKDIKTILDNANRTAQDVETLKQKLRRLQTMKGEGKLETGMYNAADTFLKLARAASGGSADFANLNVNTFGGYQLVDPTTGKTSTVSQVIGIIADPNYNAAATQSLGDMLLNYSKLSYEAFANELQKLQAQIEAATKAINAMQALKELLNLVKTKMPADFKIPPTKMEDIPPELRDKVWATIPGKDWAEKIANIKNNGDNANAFAGLCDTYYKQVLGVTVAIPTDPKGMMDMMNKLWSTRKSLAEAIEELKRQGVSPDDSSITSLQKVLDDVNARFPVSDYPYNTKVTEYDASGRLKFVPGPGWDGSNWRTKITDYINKGNNENPNTISRNIDSATGSNQQLSTKVSDNIKIKKQQFDTNYNILNQVADALAKLLLRIIQNIKG